MQGDASDLQESKNLTLCDNLAVEEWAIRIELGELVEHFLQ